jgi:hypothetical protein
MATTGSKLITKQMQWLANMTEQSHLGAAMLARPAKLSSTMDELFSAKNIYSDNPLLSQLMGNEVTEEEITSTSWEWELKGATTRPMVIIENVEPAANTTPGKWRREFKMKGDVDWYLPGDILSPGTANKKYQVRVIDKPKPHGNGFIYRVRIMTDDSNLSIPVQYLATGSKWSKLFSQYEEAAVQSGSTQFSTTIALSNKMSKFRKEYRITDYASTEVLAVSIPDRKGKRHSSWMRYAEVEYWQQWYRELERGIWYSRSTETVKGSNGRPVRSGPGIQEMLEDSHVHYHSKLTATLIEEFLMDIFYSRTKPGQGRHVKGYTGEYGMVMFHRAIQDWMNKSGFIKNVEVFTNKVDSDLHANAIEAGYQFVRYRMANGSVLELVHNPLYDDREINYELDPISGYPLESQRITFLDFSAEGKSSNIKLMKKKDSETFSYVCGNYGPFGPAKGHFSAHSGDYYEMHVGKTCGVHINDVTRCGELILSRA